MVVNKMIKKKNLTGMKV